MFMTKQGDCDGLICHILKLYESDHAALYFQAVHLSLYNRIFPYTLKVLAF